MPVFTIPIHEHGHKGDPDYPHGKGDFDDRDLPDPVSSARIANEATRLDAENVLGRRYDAVADLEAIARTFTGPETPWFGVEIKRDPDFSGESFEDFEGPARDDDPHGVKFTFVGDGAIGHTSLVKTRDTDIRAELGLVWVDPTKRGQGLSRPILQALVAGWEQAGVSRVELDAVDLGSYAWLRYGFTPKAGRSTKLWMRSVRERLDNTKNVSPAARQHVLDALADVDAGDGKAAWRIADLRDGKRNLGLELLREIGWRGELDLKDPEQRTRFDHYLKG